MLDSLKFVQGAVAKKDFVPELTHFYIGRGVIKGYNGRLALCSPLDLDLETLPQAIPFVKAINACRDTIQLSMTDKERLAIKSGPFKAYIDCRDAEVYPEVEPEGNIVYPPGPILPALQALAPFIAEDASREWARGILLRGCSAYATNNIILAEYWLGCEFPSEVNIPKEAVLEILRIGSEPEYLMLSDNSVTFVYEQDKWLRSQLFNTAWPGVSEMLDKPSNQKTIPAELKQALDDLLPFVDDWDRVYLLTDEATTSMTENMGGSVTVPGLCGHGAFNIKQLRALLNIANTIDLSLYPGPCLFYGEQLRGVIMGMRV